MDVPDDLGLDAGDGFCPGGGLFRSRRGREAAQGKRTFAELGEDDAVEAGAVAGAVAVGVKSLGDEAVLLDEVVDHVPLAAVAEGFLEEGLDETIVQGQVGGAEDLLEEPVGLLELVPKEEIGLGKLEGVELVLLHQGHPKHVGRGEQPAPPARPLVGDGASLEGDLHIEYMLVCNLSRRRSDHLCDASVVQGRKGKPRAESVSK